MSHPYALWKADRTNRMPAEDRLGRPSDPHLMLGYWRIEGSRTKPDFPVMIFEEPDKNINPNGEVTLQIGRQRPATDEATWADFLSGSWFKCHAVTKADYDVALETGKWPDGKISRVLTEDEKLGLAAGEGSNQAPVEEALAAEIRELAAEITALPEPKSQTEADVMAGLLDKMRGLRKRAEGERVTEKEPHLAASREVDAKWKAIDAPGAAAYEAGEAKRKAFLRKEQARLDAEAAAERKRIAEETAERLRKEAEERAAAEAAQRGEEAAAAPDIDEEEIARQAEAAAAEQVPEQRAVAGSAYGTRRGLKAVKKGEITDAKAFAGALIDIQHGDLMALLQQLANRAAKAGMPQPGMKIVEIQE